MTDDLRSDIADMFASFTQREWFPSDAYQIVRSTSGKSRAWDSKAARLRARALGLCSRCQQVKPKDGRFHCARCIGKIAAWQSGPGRERHRARSNRLKSERRVEAASTGTCRACLRRPARDARTTCETCARKQAEYYRGKPRRESKSPVSGEIESRRWETKGASDRNGGRRASALERSK